jgi:hypothetical protein
LFLSLLLRVRFVDSKRKTRSSTLLSSTEVAHALPLPPSSTPTTQLSFLWLCVCTLWIYFCTRVRWWPPEWMSHHEFTCPVRGFDEAMASYMHSRDMLCSCMHGLFFTRGRCNYHSILKKKTLHGLKALNYLGFGIARNLIVLSRIFQLKKNSI